MKRLVRCLPLAILFLLVMAPAHAFAYWDVPITGTVWSAAGSVLPGIDVTAYESTDRTGDGGDSWRAVARATSRADGTYTLMSTADLRDGAYFRILFTDPEHRYRSAFFLGPEVPDVTSAPDSLTSTEAALAAPSYPGGRADVLLKPFDASSGTIRGRMWDALTGTDGSGYVYAYRWDPATQTGVEAYRQGTEADGSYTMYGTGEDGKPLAGEFKLRFENLNDNTFLFEYWEHYANMADSPSVFVEPGQLVSGIDFAVKRKAPLVGHVYGPDGKPVSNAMLDVYELNPGTGHWEYAEHTADSDANGQFVLYKYADPLPGTIRISAFDRYRRYVTTFYGGATDADHGKSIVIPGGTPVTGIDIYMAGRPAIAGRVTRPGTDDGVPDVLVTAYKATPYGYSWDAQCYTNGSGSYFMPVDGGGTYRVEFTDSVGHRYYYKASTTLDGASNVAVASSGIASGVNVAPPGFGGGLAERVYGDDRYQTALELSAKTFPSAVTSQVVLASGELAPDALSGSALAGSLNAPLLLTKKTQLPPGTLAELDRLGAQHIFVIGGPGSIGENVVDMLRCTGYDCERIAGDDRYGTSALVAKQVAKIGGATSAFVVRGDTFPDALAVAPLAYRTHRPVLLVRPAALPSAIASAATDMQLTQVLAVGSPNAIGEGVLTELRGKVASVTRIASGRDRYETAALTARYAIGHGWLTPAVVGVARGDTFPDALGGGSAMGNLGGPVLLTKPSSLAPATSGCIGDWRPNIKRIKVFGSPSAVSSAVFAQLAK